MSWNPAIEPQCPNAGFEHHAEDALPFLQGEGKQVRLIIGNAWGERAPTKTFTDMFYADAVLEAGASIPLPTTTRIGVSISLKVQLKWPAMHFKPGR